MSFSFLDQSSLVDHQQGVFAGFTPTVGADRDVVEAFAVFRGDDEGGLLGATKPTLSALVLDHTLSKVQQAVYFLAHCHSLAMPMITKTMIAIASITFTPTTPRKRTDTMPSSSRSGGFQLAPRKIRATTPSTARVTRANSLRTFLFSSCSIIYNSSSSQKIG